MSSAGSRILRTMLALAAASTALSVGATSRRSAPPAEAQRIAYAASHDRNWDVYVVGDDGTGATRLTTRPEQ